MNISTTTLDEVISSAVLWWANHVSELPKEGISGDRDSQQSFMVLYSRLMVYLNNTPSDADVKRFIQNLEDYLRQESKKRNSMLLCTDYGPEYPLSDICQRSGIITTGLPQKTTMWIYFEKGIVSYSTVRGSSGQIYPVLEK